ncbi:MAG: ribosome silencing factor [Acidibacillus sp.]|uniref:Ribosomal silencing factor RsfS n=1 Tax=Sulfoacidibacillus ferrooxidans TaxID=2005001 RepID=A0A9X2AAS4_9BACL|nr:ribosome silencing factor [Sulfoacidibacillus ferrooxidans]MCI0181914.1 Ribosomal silencing factor RsfS [Sulfoacidibacillus ferrooxidans]MCY0892790.1 ribosome silencing factor [Acidibacillus sp.]
MRDQCREYAKLAADAAEDKKANDVVILDIRELSIIADYFVICSANSRTQAQAIADSIEEHMELRGVKMRGTEGHRDGKWVLLDFGDVIVHVFQEEERRFFDLERLWGDAPRLSMSV